jgi:cyclophilin family peptidyl-prolyl cis-trans isomerase
MLFDHVRKMLLFAGLALLVLAMACGSDDGDTSEPESGGAAPAAQVDQPQSCEDNTLKSGSKSYSAPPPMSIDPDKSYTATFCMEGGGQFTIELFAKEAPNTVNSFVFLAREQFYNGTTFHRVLANFMAQGGDPTGKGTGGPGYRFDNELTPLRRHDGPGILSMANSGISNGRGTNGSQFFITFIPTPSLDGYNPDGTAKDCSEGSCHTVFGRVIEGMDVVNGISLRDPGTARTPGDAIATIIIEESG